MSLWRSQNDAASNMIVKETFDQHTTRSQLTGRDLYLRAGIEIQARIHEVLLDGYQRWGTLPQNREQLIVAMADMGMKPPASVMQSLEQSPTIAETRQVFGGNSSATPPASRDISRAIGTLTETGRTEFWNRSMPALYSDLIEMYGDGPGRARFGLGDNPWPQHRAQAEKLSDSFGKAAEPSSSVPTAPKTAKASPPSPQQATPVAEKAESTPGHSKISLKGGVTGAALAIGVGIAAAAQPGATQRSVTDSMVDSALPGWMSARKGESCKAFGEVAGAVASGAAALAASVPIIGAAVTVTAVSGPAAPVVGTAAAIGATAAVAGVAVATNEAVAPAVETACKLSVSTYQTVKNKLGF